MTDSPRIVNRPAPTLESAIMELLPTTGSVEVQRDSPGREHAPHTHPTAETLAIVDGSITFRWNDQESTAGPGDRLLLPAEYPHGSVAGPDGCVYVIALHH